VAKATIKHQALITNKTETFVDATFITESACAACHAKSACNPSERKELTVSIKTNIDEFSIGETVNIIMQKELGFKAVLLGYGIPFILLFTVLVGLIEITGKELFSSLVTIISLVIYYSILYAFRNKLEESFTFKLEKI